MYVAKRPIKVGYRMYDIGEIIPQEAIDRMESHAVRSLVAADHIAEVSDDADAEQIEAAARGQKTTDTEIDPGEYNVTQLTEHLDTVEDEDELKRLLKAEKKDKDRETAKAAIEARLEAVRAANEEPQE